MLVIGLAQQTEDGGTRGLGAMGEGFVTFGGKRKEERYKKKPVGRDGGLESLGRRDGKMMCCGLDSCLRRNDERRKLNT